MRSLILGILLVVPAAAYAADIPNFPKPLASPARPAGIEMSCKEWTDACRICTVGDKGAPNCSNVGIACLPEKWRCTRP